MNRTDIPAGVTEVVQDIDNFLDEADYAPTKEPTRGKERKSVRQDLQAVRLDLLNRLDQKSRQLEPIQDRRADRRFYAVLIGFFLTTLFISALVFYVTINAPTAQQVSLIGGAIGEGGILYFVIREFHKYLSESAAAHNRALVQQAMNFGRYALASLPDADVLQAVAMVKEMIVVIYSGKHSAH